MRHATHDARSPWKPCDLRGPYPEAVSPELFQRIGGGLGSKLPIGARVLVAGDFRLSTPALKRALIDGLLGSGVVVLDAGEVPTPIAYFCAQELHADAALVVTASHNPPSQNGLKLLLRGLPPTPEQLLKIRRWAEANHFRQGHGKREAVDLVPQYERQIAARFCQLNPKCLPDLVLDAGNGAWSEIAPRIFRQLGFAITCLSCRPDGAFPDRSPDCSRPANLAGLRAAVARRPNTIGIAWDGDGDRVAFVDDTGAYVSPDEISLLLVRAMLECPQLKAPVIVDVKFSEMLTREILKHGGEPLLERTGHAFMRRRMVQEKALLGLDACGHYFFRELGGGDDGLFSALFMLELLQDAKASLAGLRRDLPRIYSTPELRLPSSLLDFPAVAARLSSTFSLAQVTELDGMRFLLNDGVVLVRRSTTEPVVSLRLEGFDQAAYEQLLDRTLLALGEAEPQLRQQLAEAVT